ncbi:MAG: S1C family serine protease [Haloarculaceae archaeon]
MTDTTDTNTYERLYRETIPSVVSVYVTPGGGDERDERGRHGAGSGFVYDRTHVVTNQHVVGDATEADLRFSERDWRRGRVVGTDAYTDLAVVAVEDLPAYATSLELVAEVPAPDSQVAAPGSPWDRRLHILGDRLGLLAVDAERQRVRHPGHRPDGRPDQPRDLRRSARDPRRSRYVAPTSASARSTSPRPSRRPTGPRRPAVFS